MGNWKGSTMVEEGQTSLWQAVLGNQNRSVGGWELCWEVQEGSEARCMDSWDARGSDKVGFAWEALLPRHSLLHLWSNGGDLGLLNATTLSVTFTFLILFFTDKNTVAQFKTLCLLAGGASLNFGDLSNRLERDCCSRLWGAVAGVLGLPKSCASCISMHKATC